MVRRKRVEIIAGIIFLVFTGAIALIPAGESIVWKFWFRMNLVDICLWLFVAYMGIRYEILDWRPDNPMLFNLFLFFYGVILIYRLGMMNLLQWELVQRCLDAGVDISDILP